MLPARSCDPRCRHGDAIYFGGLVAPRMSASTVIATTARPPMLACRMVRAASHVQYSALRVLDVRPHMARAAWHLTHVVLWALRLLLRAALAPAACQHWRGRQPRSPLAPASYERDGARGPSCRPAVLSSCLANPVASSQPRRERTLRTSGPR